MSISGHFSIPYVGMKNGFHKYTFNVNSDFFAEFEHSLIKEGDFEIVVDIDKREGISDLSIKIQGRYAAVCDRCLAAIRIPVSGVYSMVVKVTKEEVSDDDEVIYIKEDQSHLSLGQVFYELICLSLPWTNVYDCQNEKVMVCNQVVLSRLEQAADDDMETGNLWEGLKGIRLDEE